MTWVNERVPEAVHEAVTVRMCDPGATRPLRRTASRRVRTSTTWSDFRTGLAWGAAAGCVAYAGYVLVVCRLH